MDQDLLALSGRVGEFLQQRGWLLATAESCTGGWVAEVVTATAGSSGWFDCGLITYSNEAKQSLLGVADQVLHRHGAVSESTVAAMVSGTLTRSQANVALATSGIAGPGGGSETKPVGTVCFAWGLRGAPPETEIRHFDGAREEVRRQAVVHALQGLLARYDMRSQGVNQFGKGSIMRRGDGHVEKDIQTVSTGALGLDIALGLGGLPRGRVVEIYGPESSGKTTLTLQVIAEMQKLGGTAAFIDAEHALDVSYAAKLGVNIEDLLISQPDTGEQALEIADMLVRSGGVDVVVIDSVAALTPKAEIEGEMGDQLPGLQARLMSQALRKLTANIKRTNTLVIFINQIRMKIGIMMPGQNTETTTGGNALKFYASVRLDIRRIGAGKKG